MFAYCLADFFNLELWKRGQPISYADARDGINDLLVAAIDALSLSHVRVEELTVRLYGGWHDRETKSFTPIRDLLAKVVRQYPRRGSIRLRVQIAEAMISYPFLAFTETLRRAPYSPSGHLGAIPSNCLLGNACSLSKVSCWLRGKCPETDCAVKTRDVIYARQQKIVDTLITADSLFLAHSQQADVLLIASDDDDMVPALIGGRMPGTQVFHMRRSRLDPGCYDNFLEEAGVVIYKW